MSINTAAHLNFRGDAREALAFYQSVFGGQLTAITYQDMGAVQDPAEADQIVWGQVASDDGFTVMAYDVPSSLPFDRGQTSFFVSVRGETVDEISALWPKLADGATVLQPLEPSQWSPLYGMLVDRFGITWVVDVAVAYAG
jgi:PhnB protein